MPIHYAVENLRLTDLPALYILGFPTADQNTVLRIRELIGHQRGKSAVVAKKKVIGQVGSNLRMKHEGMGTLAKNKDHVLVDKCYRIGLYK